MHFSCFLVFPDTAPVCTNQNAVIVRAQDRTNEEIIREGIRIIHEILLLVIDEESVICANEHTIFCFQQASDGASFQKSGSLWCVVELVRAEIFQVDTYQLDDASNSPK